MYFTDRTYNTLSSSDVDGSNVEVLYSSFSEPHDFYLDESLGYFYVCDKSAGSVVRISTTDYSGETLVSGLSGPVGIVYHDDGYLYVSDASEGYIYRMDADGSSYEVIISGLVTPRSLLNGNDKIYYVEASASQTANTGAVNSFSTTDYTISSVISNIGSPNTIVLSSDGLTMYVTDDYIGCVFSATVADAPVTLDQDTACFASATSPRAIGILSTSTDDDAGDADDDDDDDDVNISWLFFSKRFWAIAGFLFAVAFVLCAVRRYRRRSTSSPYGWPTKEEEPLISA